MIQFINGSDAAYADLEARARSSCVVFRAQEMPPGTSPARARVGFEIDPVDGFSSVFVFFHHLSGFRSLYNRMYLRGFPETA